MVDCLYSFPFFLNEKEFFNVINCVIFIIRCGTCTDIGGGSKYVHSLSDIKFILINAASLYTRKS
jgi:hypothetical protein